MQKTKIICIFLAAIFCITLCCPIQVQASQVGSFSLRAVIPENQVDLKNTYFDLRLQPGQTQTVQLRLTNGYSEAIRISLSLHTASTGRNGIILYEERDSFDQSLAYKGQDYAQILQSEVTVPAGEEKFADIKITMPTASFDGCLLSGIYATAEPVNGQVNTSTATENIQLSNHYAYTIGLKLTQNDKHVSPELHLKSIQPALVNYRPMINVNLQNSEAVIIKGIQINGEIFRKGSDVALRTVDKNSVDMAPNSNFDLGFDWGDGTIKPGWYRLKLRATYKERIWEWDEEFEVKAETVDQINQDSLFKAPKVVWPYIVIGLLSLTILLMLLFLILGKRRKDTEENR